MKGSWGSDRVISIDPAPAPSPVISRKPLAADLKNPDFDERNFYHPVYLQQWINWHREKFATDPHRDMTGLIYFKNQDDTWRASRMLSCARINRHLRLDPCAGKWSLAQMTALEMTPDALSLGLLLYYETKKRFPHDQSCTHLWQETATGHLYRASRSFYTFSRYMQMPEGQKLFGARSFEEFVRGEKFAAYCHARQISLPLNHKELHAHFFSARYQQSSTTSSMLKRAFTAPGAKSEVSQNDLAESYMNRYPLINLRLEHWLDIFRTTQNRDPQTQDLVLDIDPYGDLVALPVSWHDIDKALANRTHGVESPAVSLRNYLCPAQAGPEPGAHQPKLDLT